MYHRAMLCRVLSALGSVLLVSGSNTFAADFSSSVSPKEGWKLAADAKEVIIYSRPHADSNLKEFKAIGSIDAPSYAVHAVIDDSWIAATEHLQPALEHTSRPHTPLSPPPPFGHDTGEGRAQTKDDLGGRVTHPVRPGFVSQTE